MEGAVRSKECYIGLLTYIVFFKEVIKHLVSIGPAEVNVKVGRIFSVKVDEAITFLKNNEKKGWVNLQIKKGRSGNPYIELDTFEPKAKTEAKPKEAPAPEPEEEDGDLPF